MSTDLLTQIPDSLNKKSICFICGNKTIKNLINSKTSNGKSPAFPFLEYHDPAPGAEPIVGGAVVCCMVCKQFLVYQWMNHEKRNIHESKRTYWMKRPPGCEIRQPMSQLELDQIFDGSSDDERNNWLERESPDIEAKKPKLDISSFNLNSSISLVHCYLCGFHGTKDKLFKVFVRSKRDTDSQGVCMEHLLQKLAFTKAQIYGDGTTFLCEKCYETEMNSVKKVEPEPQINLEIVQKLAEMIAENKTSPEQKVETGLKIEDNTDARPCAICEREQAWCSLMTSPIDTEVAENSEIKLGTEQAFFPLLTALQEDSSESNVTVCRICFHNMNEQWTQKEAQKKKRTKRERWLRTYEIHNAVCPVFQKKIPF